MNHPKKECQKLWTVSQKGHFFLDISKKTLFFKQTDTKARLKAKHSESTM